MSQRFTPALRIRRLLLGATSIAALGLATATPAHAIDWTGATSSDWFSAGNWSTGVPTSGDDVSINTVTPNATVVGAAGAQARSFSIGASGTGSLSVQNGGTVSDANMGFIGVNSGSTGTVTVTGAGSSWTSSYSLFVGHSGTGTLSVQNGGAVSANADGVIAFNASSTGMATVTGAGSSWTNSGDLTVGYFGTGTLSVQNGGAVSDVIGRIGYHAGSTGTVTVDGAGSSWTNSGDLQVGASGTGTLSVLNGGAVSNNTGYIGFNSGSSGTVTVDGAGSSWAVNSGGLRIGYSGTGTLSVQNGGAVSANTDGVIGLNAGSTGTVTVTGAGSSWTNSVDLQVGASGAGTLNVQNGGAVSDAIGYIGLYSGSTGTVTVTGAGSSWTNTYDLEVGHSGAGTLSVQNGGAVSNGRGYLGFNAGSTGTVTVDGAGSSWTNSGDLQVGVSGTGTLSVLNGGAVSNVNGVIGFNAGSTGTVTVTGAGSSWTNSGPIPSPGSLPNSGGLYVGGSGTGTLNVQNGGAVSDSVGLIGSNSGSTGTVTVTGAGSSWTNSGDLYVGESGTGTLNVLNGGAVSNNYGNIGLQSGSTGTVTVDGAGSSWTNSGDLYVGESGTGTLSVRNGAAVSDAYGYIGFNSGAGYSGSGTVTVTGVGSSWTNSADLHVGESGTGTLSVQNGGAVSDVIGEIGYNSGSTGTVTVAGIGSTWSNSGSLTVGDFGTGTLTIQNGGTVNVAGSVVVAGSPGSTGTLNIGAASGQAAVAPGTLNAASVAFGDGTGSVVFNHTASNYSFAPAISGAGSVTVEAGTTILTGANTYTGPTTINGGRLAVNGSIASSTTVNGGTLSGAGTVGDTTINNGGTFAPGSGAPGSSMAVSGNLAFQSGAIYLVQLNPSTASFADVTGTATLGGATLNAMLANGSYVSKQYTILTAAGGVSGAFASVANTNLPSNFHTTLSYDANNAYLNLVLNFGIPGGLNGNQQGVGNALTNSFNTNGSLPIVYGSLSAAGLTQASGESATGAQQTTFSAMNQFMGVMTDPFIGGRGGDASAAGSGASSFSENDDAANASAGRKRSAAERDAYAMVTKAPPANTYDPRWSVWVAGFGGSQATDGNAAAGSNSTSSRIYGTAVGADYRFSPNTIAGFALAGGGTSFSVNSLGYGRSDLFQAGAYVRHSNGTAYISAAAAYGWQDITTDRTVTIAGADHLQARLNANAYSGRLEGGYRFVAPVIGGVGLTPYAAAQFTTFDLPAYAESAISGASTFALAYAAKSVTDTRSELGLRTDKAFAKADGIVTLRGRVAWTHDFNPDRAIGATFQALAGASFVVNGAAQARDAVLITAAVEKKWLNGWSTAATFEGEFSNVTRSYAGKGVVRHQW